MIYYLIQRRTLAEPSRLLEMLDEHLAWLRGLQEAGTVLFSGPTTDRKYGLFLVRSDSRASVEAIARRDPMTVAGLCDFEVLEWRIDQAFGIGPFSMAEAKALGDE